MPRTARIAPGGMIFHMLDLAKARARIFATDDDYAVFEQAITAKNLGLESTFQPCGSLSPFFTLSSFLFSLFCTHVKQSA